jgi:hypothetical protein
MPIQVIIRSIVGVRRTMRSLVGGVGNALRAQRLVQADELE